MNDSHMRFLESNSQYIRYSMTDFLKVQKELESHHIDLVLQSPHIYVDCEEYGQIRKYQKDFERYQICVDCVTPLPYRYSIGFHPNSLIGQRSRQYYANCIRAAHLCGSQYLCITAANACFDEPKQKLMEYCIENLNALVKVAEEENVILLLGTVMGMDSPCNASTPIVLTVNEVAEIIEQIGNSYLAAYADTQVLSIRGESLTDWFDRLGEKVRLVQFTDGNYNGYRIWGKGVLPAEKLAEEIYRTGFNGLISFQIPGERYCENPKDAQKQNHFRALSAWREVMDCQR